MEIALEAVAVFLMILFFVVPILGLLLCMCFGFIGSYRKRIPSFLTASIWLFFVQVLLCFSGFSFLAYESNNPSSEYLILDFHPFPQYISFAVNWLIPLFFLAVLQVLLLHFMKKIKIPKYLRNSMFALVLPVIGCLVIAYFVFKDFAEDGIFFYIWWF